MKIQLQLQKSVLEKQALAIESPRVLHSTEVAYRKALRLAALAIAALKCREKDEDEPTPHGLIKNLARFGDKLSPRQLDEFFKIYWSLVERACYYGPSIEAIKKKIILELIHLG